MIMTSMISPFSLTVLTLAANALLGDKKETHGVRLSTLAMAGSEGSVSDTGGGDVGSGRASAASFTISACVFAVLADDEDVCT